MAYGLPSACHSASKSRQKKTPAAPGFCMQQNSSWQGSIPVLAASKHVHRTFHHIHGIRKTTRFSIISITIIIISITRRRISIARIAVVTRGRPLGISAIPRVILLSVAVSRDIVLIPDWRLCAIAAGRCLLIAIALWWSGIALLTLWIGIVVAGRSRFVSTITWTGLLTTRASTKSTARTGIGIGRT